MGILVLGILTPFIVIAVTVLPKYFKHKKSTYKVASGNGFLKTLLDKGNYGEFLTFDYLEKLDGHHKLMTNLYIPKKDGSTTEIDLIMLSETGIYVFESKNYSGWIFGDDKNKNWMQTLENKQKHRFYNPIWQNKGHITALKSVVEIENDNLYKSYIVFSERCTLKKITVTSSNVVVVKRNDLIKSIKRDIAKQPKLMSKEEVDQLYVKLQKYTRVDDRVKKARIYQIRMNNL